MRVREHVPPIGQNERGSLNKREKGEGKKEPGGNKAYSAPSPLHLPAIRILFHWKYSFLIRLLETIRVLFLLATFL